MRRALVILSAVLTVCLCFEESSSKCHKEGDTHHVIRLVKMKVPPPAKRFLAVYENEGDTCDCVGARSQDSAKPGPTEFIVWKNELDEAVVYVRFVDPDAARNAIGVPEIAVVKGVEAHVAILENAYPMPCTDLEYGVWFRKNGKWEQYGQQGPGPGVIVCPPAPATCP